MQIGSIFIISLFFLTLFERCLVPNAAVSNLHLEGRQMAEWSIHGASFVLGSGGKMEGKRNWNQYKLGSFPVSVPDDKKVTVSAVASCSQTRVTLFNHNVPHDIMSI